MQHCQVVNFRARLRRLGYTGISICRAKEFTNQEVYRVVAVEPLAGCICVRYMSIMDMFYWR